jgi:hypothetical protein
MSHMTFRILRNDFLIFTRSYFMSFNLLTLHEQCSLLVYLKRDPCLPEELVDVLSKLVVSIAKLTNEVCVYILLLLSFLDFYQPADTLHNNPTPENELLIVG